MFFKSGITDGTQSKQLFSHGYDLPVIMCYLVFSHRTDECLCSRQEIHMRKIILSATTLNLNAR